MPHRLLAPAAMAMLLCLTTTGVPAQTSGQTSGQTSAQPSTQASTQKSAQTPGAMNAEQGWASIARCAQEESERGRHTCVDRVLNEAGLLTSEMHARQQRQAFGLDERGARTPPPPVPSSAGTPAEEKPSIAGRLREPAPAPAPAPAPSRPAIEGSSSPTTAPPPTQPDRLEVELAKVEKAASGRLFVTTTDGAVWLQTESVQMPQPPAAGDRMTIRKGSMGGYRCSVASTHLTYRCARSR